MISHRRVSLGGPDLFSAVALTTLTGKLAVAEVIYKRPDIRTFTRSLLTRSRGAICSRHCYVVRHTFDVTAARSSCGILVALHAALGWKLRFVPQGGKCQSGGPVSGSG
ncbi:hypothetical protein PF005_g3971 [Phytophthora fragariae]|uniref:Uncharacterized protein n=1 Tax=Phytophthora fragariae TaxID=53985 RepID=A0A6A4E8W7_9STRA|nr:hypothetical protein PF009_g5885 [Phytophthora fragariae]KAE9128048.1 hypothetical protein PF007_g5397 [Phytophthora fragariae]KAE9151163.1 hypothetical protein PF006_g4528 [Phytophthora fragariae]KAE9229213.1 hypothetical protein PF005_g3971 [Phytophthora fragariae]KAE9246996.1 hypothetical protein PF004_g4533 [Phytophthora fragariae]